MRKLIIATALSALVALPVAVGASEASAGCGTRKTTGTVVGGVGGALIGSAVTDGSAGTILGGLGGALVGRQVAKSGCKSSPRRVVYRERTVRQASSQPTAVRKVYYDQYGNAVGSAPVRR